MGTCTGPERGGGARERRSRKRIQNQNGGDNVAKINHS